MRFFIYYSYSEKNILQEIRFKEKTSVGSCSAYFETQIHPERDSCYWWSILLPGFNYVKRRKHLSNFRTSLTFHLRVFWYRMHGKRTITSMCSYWTDQQYTTCTYLNDVTIQRTEHRGNEALRMRKNKSK